LLETPTSDDDRFAQERPVGVDAIVERLERRDVLRPHHHPPLGNDVADVFVVVHQTGGEIAGSDVIG